MMHWRAPQPQGTHEILSLQIRRTPEHVQYMCIHAALTADVERVRIDEAIQPARQHAALTADVERVVYDYTRDDECNASIVETSMRKF